MGPKKAANEFGVCLDIAATLHPSTTRFTATVTYSTLDGIKVNRWPHQRTVEKGMVGFSLSIFCLWTYDHMALFVVVVVVLVAQTRRSKWIPRI